MSSWETIEDSSADSVSLTAPDAQDCLTMHSISSDSVEALDSTSSTSELSWFSNMIILSKDTTCSPTFNETSEVLSIGSDLKINSRDTSVWSSIGDDDTSEEVSWRSDEASDVNAAATASDLTIVSTDTTCSPPFSDTSEEDSWSSDYASDRKNSKILLMPHMGGVKKSRSPSIHFTSYLYAPLCSLTFIPSSPQSSFFQLSILLS
ncbi:unnamed protein product [Pleuronectes platessa]|uniref:Uncharacterized protein n=1 Tax=Pleuronectes platessa TaxID=8262 RepID=A0A9N7YDU1_PLEPL|nr:unnamed protein product [Pleuronectes platessa]